MGSLDASNRSSDHSINYVLFLRNVRRGMMMVQMMIMIGQRMVGSVFVLIVADF